MINKNLNKIKLILLIFIVLISIQLIISEEQKGLNDEEFKNSLDNLQKNNQLDNKIIENMPFLTIQQRQEIIKTIKPVKNEFWQQWRELNLDTKNNLLTGLDQPQRDVFMSKYSQSLGLPEDALKGFGKDTTFGINDLIGNQNVYFDAKEIESHNSGKTQTKTKYYKDRYGRTYSKTVEETIPPAQDPIVKVIYEKKDGIDKLSFVKKSGNSLELIGKGYFSAEEETVYRLKKQENGNNIQDSKNSLTGKWNGKGHATFDFSKDKPKFTLDYGRGVDGKLEPTNENFATITTQDGKIFSVYQKPVKKWDAEGKRISEYEMNKAEITFNENGEIDILSNAYANINNNEFFAGEDTKYFNDFEEYNNYLKTGENIDRNILVYDENFVGQDGKKGLILQDTKGRSIYEDLIPKIESALQNPVETAQVKELREKIASATDPEEIQKLQQELSQLQQTQIKSLGTRLRGSADVLNGNFNSENAKALVESLISDSDPINQGKGKVLKSSIESYNADLEKYNSMPEGTLQEKLEKTALGAKLELSKIEIPVLANLDVNTQIATQLGLDINDPSLKVLSKPEVLSSLGTLIDLGFPEQGERDIKAISKQTLSFLADIKRTSEQFPEYQQGFVQTKLGADIGTLIVNQGIVNNQDYSIYGSAEGIGIGRASIANSNAQAFDIGLIQGNGDNQFSISSDEYGRPIIERVGSKLVYFGNTKLFDTIKFAEVADEYNQRRRLGKRIILKQVLGAQLYLGNIEVSIDEQHAAQLTSLLTGERADSMNFYAILADSDYKIEYQGPPQYQGSGISAGKAREKFEQTLRQQISQGLISLDEIRQGLTKPLEGTFSSENQEKTREFIASNQQQINQIITDITSVSQTSAPNSELRRALFNLANKGYSYDEIESMVRQEVVDTIDFVSSTIRKNNYQIKSLSTEGGSGLYQTTVNNNVYTPKNPDIAALAHIPKAYVIESFGFDKQNQNLIYNLKAGQFIFHPGQQVIREARTTLAQKYTGVKQSTSTSKNGCSILNQRTSCR